MSNKNFTITRSNEELEILHDESAGALVGLFLAIIFIIGGIVLVLAFTFVLFEPIYAILSFIIFFSAAVPFYLIYRYFNGRVTRISFNKRLVFL